MSKWQYWNIKFPMDTLHLMTNDDIQLLLRAFVCEPCTFDPDCCEATTGASGIGCWEEGDIDFIAIDGTRRTLSYDFIVIDDEQDLGRVFLYMVYDNE